MLSSLLSLFLQPLAQSGDLHPAYRDLATTYLVQAQVYYERIEGCSLTGPESRRREERQQELQARLQRATYDANEIYGPVDPVADAARITTTGPASGCSPRDLNTHFRVAAGALDEAEQLLRADAAPRSRGLWLGNLHLCGDRVTTVEDGEPAFDGGPPSLVMHFSEAFAPRVEALTARLVQKPLSLVLNGTIIATPIVREPLVRALNITGSHRLPVDRVRVAMAAHC